MYTPFISQLREQLSQELREHYFWTDKEVIMAVFDCAAADVLAGILDEQSRMVKKDTLQESTVHDRSARDYVQAFWNEAVCEELSEPNQAMREKLNGQNISAVWEWYQEWFSATCGPDVPVLPGRNQFCGRTGLFLTVATQYVTTKRTRAGRIICVR